MKLWPFRPAPPSIADCARQMAEFRSLTDKERYKLNARRMRSEMGLPAAPRLEPRT